MPGCMFVPSPLGMSNTPDKRFTLGSLFRNWLSLTGAILAIASCFSFLLLFLMDAFAHGSNPYIGVLTYFVSPIFFAVGVALTLLGLYLRRRRAQQDAAILPRIQIDLSRPRD